MANELNTNEIPINVGQLVMDTFLGRIGKVTDIRPDFSQKPIYTVTFGDGSHTINRRNEMKAIV